jgi:hypothetical protein
MTRKEAIQIFLDRCKTGYIEDQLSKGIRASGKSAESLKTQSEESTGKLIGAQYFTQQKFGLKPGTWVPVEAIVNWIKVKGITATDISEESLIFLIRRKIFRLGTDIHIGKRPGISIEEVLLKARIELLKSLRDMTVNELINKALDQLRQTKDVTVINK